MNGDYSTIERPPLRVLLIEDNPEDADLVRERLDGESVCVTSTSTGPPRWRPAESGLPRGRPT